MTLESKKNLKNEPCLGSFLETGDWETDLEYGKYGNILKFSYSKIYFIKKFD